MSHTESLPWLRAEKQFVRRAAEDGVAVLGICLGAQLIANAFGGRVYPNAEKEIGWFEIEAAASSGDGFRFPPRCMAFHWHGETFDLPAGGKRLLQKADGYVATVKSGVVTFRDGEAQGAYPGGVIRGPQRVELAMAAE